MMGWSFSGARQFQYCRRAWFFKSHIANSRARAGTLEHETYILSKLQTIQAWRGSLVDHVISTTIIPEFRRGVRPHLPLALAAARRLFETQLTFAREHRIREAGMTATKAGTAFAAFYDTEYGIQITEEQLASAWNDIGTSLTNLFEIAHLSKALSTAAVLVPQRTLMFDRFGTRIVARPDLIGFRATKPPFIVDWKVQTSAPRDYRHQLATYAMALQHCKPHVDFPASGQSATSISLVEVQLLVGKLHVYRLNEDDLEDLDDYVGQSATQMTLALGSAPEQRTIDDFPTTNNPDICLRCAFRKVCWEDRLWQDSKQTSLIFAT
jgi:PD-(D/E)XK nuclease superfamily